MSTTTQNFGFKKPESTEFYDIGDQNDNWDAAEAALSDTKDSTVTFTEVVEDADIASGDSHATLFGKIKKRFSTIALALAGKIDTDKIISTGLLTTTEPGFLPDLAALATILNEQNNNLNKLNLPSYFRRFFQDGYSPSTMANANEPDAMVMTGYGIANAPTQGGVIIFTMPYYSAGGSYYSQICFAVQNTSNVMYIRVCNDGTWNAWTQK